VQENKQQNPQHSKHYKVMWIKQEPTIKIKGKVVKLSRSGTPVYCGNAAPPAGEGIQKLGYKG